MFPVTAASFIAVKVYSPADMAFIYGFYFIGWLLLTIAFLLKRSLEFTTKYSLLLGSILGLLVPVANGTVTGNWVWKSHSSGFFQVFFVDALWIGLSLAGLYSVFKMNRRQTT